MTLDKIRILKHAPCLVFAAILGVQLFVPPTIGLANNGDFPKVMGLFDLGAPRGDEYGYVDWIYRFDPIYHWEAGFYSSETLVAAAPISLSHAFSKDGSFDLRWMGLVHGLLFLLAVYLMEGLLTPVEGWRWYVLWAVIAIGFGDVMYTSYFNSFYMDAATYVFLMLSVVLFLRAATWRRKSDAIWLVICVALLLLSKSQHAILGLWIAPLFAFFGRSLWPGNGRLFSIASTTLVAAAALVGLELVPFDYAAHGYYSVIFWQVLPHSANVKADLEALGLDESYARFVGTHAYSAGSGFRDPEFAAAFMQRTSFARLGWYFLTHPKDTDLALDSALGEGGRQRPPMGNFDRGAGSPPFTESHSFALWSDAKRALFHEHGIRYGIGYALVTGLACAPAIARRKTLSSALVAGVLAIAGMGVTEVLIASLADAVDVTRHYFIAATILDMELLIVLWMVLSGLNDRFHAKSTEQQELR
ncbi:MAG: glycosyltransferase family 39 protein [Acidobacteriia bacterium]|nr:glycosyltransferase family 39 protein [Terriglobia bacterium]